MPNLLAGAYLAIHGEVPNEAEANSWISEHQSLIEFHAEALEHDDSRDCLNHLLAKGFESYSVGTMIQMGRGPQRTGSDNEYIESSILNYGFRIVENELLVANQDPKPNEIFRGTSWKGGRWREALGRCQARSALKIPSASLAVLKSAA